MKFYTLLDWTFFFFFEEFTLNGISFFCPTPLTSSKCPFCIDVIDWLIDPSFARWTNRLKQMKSKGKIKPDRLKRLEELGFIWNTATSAAGLAALWDQRFEEVKQFKKVYLSPLFSPLPLLTLLSTLASLTLPHLSSPRIPSPIYFNTKL
jgi:hypothetical protein